MKDGCDCVISGYQIKCHLKGGSQSPAQPSPAAADKVTCHNIMEVGVNLTLMLGGMDSQQNQEDLFEVLL